MVLAAHCEQHVHLLLLLYTAPTVHLRAHSLLHLKRHLVFPELFYTSSLLQYRFYFKTLFIFYGNFTFTAKLSRRCGDPHAPLFPSFPTASPVISILHRAPRELQSQNHTMHHYHPTLKLISVFTLGVNHLWVWTMIMTCVQRYCVIQNWSTALKSLHAPPVHLSFFVFPLLL